MIFRELFLFEIFYQLKRPATWLYLLMLLGGLYLVVHEIANYAITVEAVQILSPYTLADITGYANKFGLLMIAALTASAGMRDVNTRVFPLIYSTAITKMEYAVARMLAIAVLATVLHAIAIAFVIVGVNILVQDVVHGFQLAGYVQALVWLLIPTTCVQVAVCYSLVMVFRIGQVAYIGVALFFLLGVFSLEFINSGAYGAGQLMDPSGASIVSLQSYALTLAERNTQLISVSGSLLLNRISWITMAIIITWISIYRFRFVHHTKRNIRLSFLSRWRKKKQEATSVVTITEFSSGLFNKKWKFILTANLSWQYFKELIRSGFGWLLLVFTIALVFMIRVVLKGPFEVPLYITSRHVVEVFYHPILKALIILVLGMASGQLIWSARDCRMQAILDATRVSNKQFMISALFALLKLVMLIGIAQVGAGLASQGLYGYPTIEFSVYGWNLLDTIITYSLFGIACLFLHVLVQHKYVGHMLVAVFCAYALMPAFFGIEDRLWVFASDTGLSQSDFFSQQFFIVPWLIFKMYWLGVVIILIMLMQACWWRGVERNIRQRFTSGWQQVSIRAGSLLGLLLLISAGTFIYYQTHVINTYQTKEDKIKQHALYEQQLSNHKAKPTPRMIGATLNLELHPDNRSAQLTGTHYLVNMEEHSLEKILISLSDEVITSDLTFYPLATVLHHDSVMGWYVYKLERPLAPFDTLKLRYSLAYTPSMFSQAGVAKRVMDNGTWIALTDWLPKVGYQHNRELQQPALRKRYGLREHPTALVSEVERVNIDMVIGTSSDQVPVTGGTLVRKWQSNNRNYVQYQATGVVLDLVDVYSCNYTVKQSAWNDKLLTILYHPDHAHNITTFEQAATVSLAYYTNHFGNYRGTELKLVEYPDAGIGGISLAGTIAYSSKFALMNATDAINLPFAVVAHEVAHQWWGHQVAPDRQRGGVFLSESLAWYSALCVVEETLGVDELERLLKAMRTSVLHPRTRAQPPLLEANDYFLAYRKGPLALYALKEYIGDTILNRSLRQLLKQSADDPTYQSPAYDFYDALKSAAPDTLHQLIDDMVRFNTFWELETKHATYTKTGAEYEVTLRVNAEKLTVDKDNQQVKIPMSKEWIEVGVTSKDSLIYLQKHPIKTGMNTIIIRTSALPETAGIDPRNLLMDTEQGNNVRRCNPAKI